MQRDPLAGVMFHKTEASDVLALRWSGTQMLVVRANRRNFRRNPVTWTVTRATLEDPRKQDFKRYKATDAAGIRALTEGDKLLRSIAKRFAKAATG